MRTHTHTWNGLFTFALKSAISNRCFSPLFQFKAFTFQSEHDKRMNFSIKLIHQLKCQKRQLNVNQLKCQESKLSLDKYTLAHTQRTANTSIVRVFLCIKSVKSIKRLPNIIICYVIHLAVNVQHRHTHSLTPHREHRTSTEQHWHGLIPSIKL